MIAPVVDVAVNDVVAVTVTKVVSPSLSLIVTSVPFNRIKLPLKSAPVPVPSRVIELPFEVTEVVPSTFNVPVSVMAPLETTKKFPPTSVFPKLVGPFSFTVMFKPLRTKSPKLLLELFRLMLPVTGVVTVVVPDTFAAPDCVRLLPSPLRVMSNVPATLDVNRASEVLSVTVVLPVFNCNFSTFVKVVVSAVEIPLTANVSDAPAPSNVIVAMLELVTPFMRVKYLPLTKTSVYADPALTETASADPPPTKASVLPLKETVTGLVPAGTILCSSASAVRFASELTRNDRRALRANRFERANRETKDSQTE